MSKKIIPSIIIFFIIIVVAALIVLTMLYFNRSFKEKENNNIFNNDLIIPVLELNLSTQKENQERVVIEVLAKTEDEKGIKYIEIPDGNKVYTDNNKYEVTKNGKYEFKWNL